MQKLDLGQDNFFLLSDLQPLTEFYKSDKQKRVN
jgi:hypothetical protein